MTIHGTAAFALYLAALFVAVGAWGLLMRWLFRRLRKARLRVQELEMRKAEAHLRGLRGRKDEV